MNTVLGLDMGTNSIGWALIDESNRKITAAGVRIFPEGVGRSNTGKEIPRNEQRRMKRQTRRQTFRRKYRKHLLAKFLMELGMFPQVEQLANALQTNPLNPALRHFFAIDPYEQRSRAFEGQALSLFELGRIFYHFAQRRGYKESLKNEDGDEGTLYEGNIKEGKAGISQTQELIDQYGTLGNALHYLDPHQIRRRNRYTTRKMYTEEFEKIWEEQKGFHPELMTDELKQKIGDATEGLLFFQRPLKPQSHLIGKCSLEKNKPRCTDSCIAFERRRVLEFINSIRHDEKPLTAEQRSQVADFLMAREKAEFGDIAKKLKINVQRCNYEAERIVTGTRSYSGLRKIFTPKIWDAKSLAEQEEILNIKRFAEDREKTKNYLNQKFGLSDKQAEQFLKLRITKGYSSLSYKATLHLLPFLERGHPYHEAVWLGGIRNAFGAAVWEALEEKVKDYIITNVIEIYNNEKFDSQQETVQWLMQEYGLTEKQLKKLYHHSRDMEHEADGSAAELGEPDNLRNPIVQQSLFELRKLVNKLIEQYGKPGRIRIELSRDLKASKEERDKMSLKQYRNELENNTVKARLDEYGKPHSTINILKLRLYQEIEQKAGSVSCPYSGNSIGLHQLWNGEVDVEHIIPYSISLDDSFANKTLCFRLFNNKKGDRTPFQFYHQEMGENAWENAKERALQLLPYNKWKRFIEEKTPTLEEFEARKLNDIRYISRQARAWLQQVCAKVSVTQGELTGRLRHLWGLDNILNPPIRTPELVDDEYFIAVNEERQLLEAIPWTANKKQNDAAFEKLSKLGRVLQGNVRKGTFFPFKTRDDHRHHAVDALTIACTSQGYLQKMSTLKGRGLTKEEWEMKVHSFPEPWPGFYQHAEKTVQQIIISHKKRSRTITRTASYVEVKGKQQRVQGQSLRGALHAETVYGKRKDVYGNEAFHVRKPLAQINKRAQVDKIVDPAIKKLVEKAIIKKWQETDEVLFEKYLQTGLIVKKGNEFEINAADKTKYEVPGGAFFEEEKDESGRKLVSIKPRVWLEIKQGERKGERIPIKKVRLKENSGGAVQLKDKANQWVEPGNNYGVLIYETETGEYRENIVTFWEAVERKKQGAPVFQLPPDGKMVIETLQINDLFLLGLVPEEIQWNKKDLLARYLFRVQKVSSMYYVFRKTTASTLEFDSEQYSIRSFKAWLLTKPIKVKVDVLGGITPF